MHENIFTIREVALSDKQGAFAQVYALFNLSSRMSLGEFDTIVSQSVRRKSLKIVVMNDQKEKKMVGAMGLHIRPALHYGFNREIVEGIKISEDPKKRIGDTFIERIVETADKNGAGIVEVRKDSIDDQWLRMKLEEHAFREAPRRGILFPVEQILSQANSTLFQVDGLSDFKIEELKRISKDDLGDLEGLYGEMGDYPTGKTFARCIEKTLSTRGAHFIVVRYDDMRKNEIIGATQMFVYPSLWLAANIADFEGLIVKEKLRGKGLGKAMIHMLLRVCEREGVKLGRARVHIEGRDPLVNYYKSVGAQEERYLSYVFPGDEKL